MNAALAPRSEHPEPALKSEDQKTVASGHARFEPEPTGRLASLTFLFVAGCLAALALGVPALAVAVAPLGVWLLWGVVADRHRACDVTLSLGRERVVEGETVELTIRVRGAITFQRVLCDVLLPSGLVADTPPARVVVAPSQSGHGIATLSIRCERWGVYEVGPCGVLASNTLGIFQSRGASLNGPRLRVYPAAPHLRAGVRPAKTQVFVGEELARERANGLEFAEIRKFQPGDLTRRINWSVTARQGEPYINLQHPDRNTDIVVIVDSLADFKLGTDGTLAWEGRAVSALTQHYLARRDRVGLISYGGVLSSLAPAAGSHHLYRLLDTLIETQVVSSYERPTVRLLPPRSLPANALVIVFSPLVDHRMLDLLRDLHGRGCDLAVVEVDPERFISPEHEATEDISQRIWRLSRVAQRHELWRSGIPLVHWDTSAPLDSTLVQLNQMRHGQWRVRA